MTAARSSPWTLLAETATLKTPGLEASLSVDLPAQGLASLRWQGKELSTWRILQVLVPEIQSPQSLSVQESYVRGADLVASYRADEIGQRQPHIYWRFVEQASRGAAGVQMIVSSQTSLLDSDPQLVCTSHFAGEELLSHDGQRSFQRIQTSGQEDVAVSSAYLVRAAGADFSFLEMIHPTDFAGAVVRPAGGSSGTWQSQFQLFPERLEKGVIRRARLAAWFVPRSGDVETSSELFQQFVEEPPPLTT